MLDTWTLTLSILLGLWLLSMVAVLSLIYAYGERNQHENVTAGFTPSRD